MPAIGTYNLWTIGPRYPEDSTRAGKNRLAGKYQYYGTRVAGTAIRYNCVILMLKYMNKYIQAFIQQHIQTHIFVYIYYIVYIYIYILHLCVCVCIMYVLCRYELIIVFRHLVVYSSAENHVVKTCSTTNRQRGRPDFGGGEGNCRQRQAMPGKVMARWEASQLAY